MADPADRLVLMAVDCQVCGEPIHFQKPEAEAPSDWANETLTCPTCGDVSNYVRDAMRRV